MSGRGKRLWPPQLTLDAAYQETVQFLGRCGEHHLAITPGRPTLYRAYFVDGTWPTLDGQDLTRVFRFGFSNDPSGDRTKQSIAKLLAVAVKGHYFMAPTASVPQEPSVFSIPDLAEPGLYRHGLIYPLQIPADQRAQGRQRAIIVAEWDLALSASRPANIPRGDEFPVILIPRGRLLDKKHWEELKKAAGTLPWFENSAHAGRRRLLEQVNAHSDRASFNYGTILDYPKGISEDVRATGAMWARGIRAWFVPHGFDAAAVTTYLDEIKAAPLDEQIRRRWWEKRSEEWAAAGNKAAGATKTPAGDS
jgi:hypothetical protein